MRAIAIVLALCGVAAADPSPVLPDGATKAIRGCWRNADERWSFQPEGDHGVVVIRSISSDRAEADRARTPSTVKFDAKTGEYGFPTAGRIHGLIMVGSIQNGALRVSVFASHDNKSWFFTGNTMTLRRCN